MSTELATTNQNNFQVFAGEAAFEAAQRMATALSKSSLVPKEYQNNLPNCLIALEAACRIKASPLQVMQNLYIVHGKPSWSSQFIIAAINTSGKFSPLRFRMEGEGEKRTCVACAIEKETGEVLESPLVSIEMAKKEGWYSKNGSKWQTMPDLMLRYRAATFFGRLYAPEILMGMKAVEEEEDIIDITPEKPSSAEALNEKFINSDEDVIAQEPESPQVMTATPLEMSGLKDMPKETPEQLKQLVDTAITLIKTGGSKLDVMHDLGGSGFMQLLADKGLMAHRKMLMEA